MMEALLRQAAGLAVPALDLIALTVIAIGTVITVARTVRASLARRAGPEAREIWVAYARWLVAALTFQLAADIVGTSITPTWDEIGRLAAIAGIRTFLDFFLGRDIDEVMERRDDIRPHGSPGEDQKRRALAG
jgi:uncharacterized membrane protein